jgi:hypothetical protein
MELTKMSWNPRIHVISEAVRSSMKSIGLSIALRSFAYLRTRKFVLAIYLDFYFHIVVKIRYTMKSREE